jgi:hypothetical protein
MRVIFTALCMGLIVVAAAVLAVIDVVIKLMPLLIVILVAVVALRLVHSHRHFGGGTTTESAPCTAVFIRPPGLSGTDAGPHIGVGPLRYPAGRQSGHMIIDGEVLDVEVTEDDRHG